MRILDTVLPPPTALMVALDPEFAGGGAIRPQVISDHPIGNEAIFLEKFAHQFQRGVLVSDLPSDPAAMLRSLRRCRQDMIAISTNVRIGSPAYVAANGITAAVDVMAEVLTGMRNYFWRASNSASDSELADHKRWAAIERGDEPWPR